MRLKRFGPSKEIEKSWHKCGNMSILTGESLGRESVGILSICISIFKFILDLPGRSHIHAHTASHHSLFLPRTGNCRGSGWWALRWSESLQNELFFQTRRGLKYMSLRHAKVLWILIILLIELDRENQSCWYFDLQSPDVKDPCICIYTIITIQNMCLYVFIVHYNDKVPASLLHKTLDAIHCK